MLAEREITVVEPDIDPGVRINPDIPFDPMNQAEIRFVAGRLRYEIRHQYAWLIAQGRTERNPSEADEVAAEYAEQARDEIAKYPPEKITYRDIAIIARGDPDEAQRITEIVKARAREMLQGGEYAASAVRMPDDDLIEDMTFLAIRENYADKFSPRNGIEWALIDAITQLTVLKNRAMKTWIDRSNSSAVEDRRQLKFEMEKSALPNTAYDDRRFRYPSSWIRPRITEQEAIDRAMAEVERWDRMINRNIRQLRDLRRYSITINNLPGGNVNLVEKQLNVSAGR